MGNERESERGMSGVEERREGGGKGKGLPLLSPSPLSGLFCCAVPVPCECVALRLGSGCLSLPVCILGAGLWSGVPGKGQQSSQEGSSAHTHQASQLDTNSQPAQGCLRPCESSLIKLITQTSCQIPRYKQQSN